MIPAALAQLFFPQRHCLLCGALTGRPGLCAQCETARSGLKRCTICAAFLSENGLCPHCAARRPLFAQARAAWPYSGPLRERLLSFKYREQTWLRRPLALLMLQTCAEHYTNVKFDAVLPVPLAPSRLKKRGYNQSELLSGLLAQGLGLPHSPRLLRRALDTPALASYDGEQRRSLLKRAFAAAPAAAGKTLLLVDDIYTSGATLSACTAALQQAGVREVYGIMAAGFNYRANKQEFITETANYT